MNVLIQILLLTLLIFLKVFAAALALFAAYLFINWLMPAETKVILDKYTK